MKNYIGLKADGMGFDAHLTLLDTGDIYSPLLQKYAESLVERWGGMDGSYVKRLELTQFGTKTVVLVEVPEYIYNIRSLLVKNWPDNPYTRTTWVPHITLKYDHNEDIIIPNTIKLHSLGVY